MNNSLNIKALFIAAFCTIALLIAILIATFSIGPGLHSAEGMTEWYLLDSNIHHTLFSGLGGYSDSENYSDSLVMMVWYFEKENAFISAEKMLKFHLNESGHTEYVDLDLNRVSSNISATKYESNKTSGYFIVYKRPFLDSREDYFITYYGTTDPTNFAYQEDEIMDMIERSYYSSAGEVTGLEIN